MSLAADGLPPLREVIAAHGLSARKALGQNFLLDLNLTAKIARRAGDLAACDVLEVGPGPGGLTRALLAEGARHVVAIERDPRCLPALAEIAAAWPGRLTVLAGDALAIDPRPHLTPPVRDRRQPALQRRHRAPGALADPAGLAAVLDEPDADVPEGGRRAHRRRGPAPRPTAGSSILAQWRASRASPSRSRRAPSRRRPRSTSAVVQIERLDGAALPGRRRDAVAGRRARLRPAAQDAARQPAPARARRRGAAGRGRHPADRPRRAGADRGLLPPEPAGRCAGADALLGLRRRLGRGRLGVACGRRRGRARFAGGSGLRPRRRAGAGCQRRSPLGRLRARRGRLARLRHRRRRRRPARAGPPASRSARTCRRDRRGRSSSGPDPTGGASAGLPALPRRTPPLARRAGPPRAPGSWKRLFSCCWRCASPSSRL